MLKKAMIMAAGVGSRLEALSNALPKPLVPLVNTPAMDIIVRHLSSFGIKKIIANTYYKSEEIQKHYKNSNFDVNFSFIKEEELSGTAGGVGKCKFFFDKGEDFLVMSGDGLSDIDIFKAYDSHKESEAIATIVLKEINPKDVSIYGVVVPGKNGQVESFQEKPKLYEAKSNLVNTGIYIFSYEIFNYIPENTFYDFAKNVFPALLESGEKINTYIMDGYWTDIGSLEQYKKANSDILNHKVKSFLPEAQRTMGGLICTGKNTIIKEGAEFTENCIIGNNCIIGRNVKIINSILWNNINVQDNVTIKNSIILNNVSVKNSIENKIETETISFEKENIPV